MATKIMNRLAIFLLFTTMSIEMMAQEELKYIENDSLRNQYEQTMRVTNIFKPKHIEISEKEVVKMADKFPAFAVYRDTYFITGIPLNRRITNNSADAIFQISIRQRLTKSVLPFNTFAYLTYSQKSFWDIYAESSPFRDTNYNPGLGLGKNIFFRGKLVGGAFVQIKHESNGRDGDESRSWNYLSIAGKYYLNPRLNISAEFWVPYVDGGNNKDLLDYRGIGTATINYISDKHRWWLSAEINPRKGFGNINTTASIGFRVSEKLNQYLFVRFYDGYSEGLLNYNKYTMNVRFGICIKPDFFSIY